MSKTDVLFKIKTKTNTNYFNGQWPIIINMGQLIYVNIFLEYQACLEKYSIPGVRDRVIFIYYNYLCSFLNLCSFILLPQYWTDLKPWIFLYQGRRWEPSLIIFTCASSSGVQNLGRNLSKGTVADVCGIRPTLRA